MKKKNFPYEKPLLKDLNVVGVGALEPCIAGPSPVSSGECANGPVPAGQCNTGGLLG